MTPVVLIALLLAPTAPAAAAAAPLPVDKVAARLQERYDSAADYRAKFTQKYTYAATGRERTSTGEILIKKPGRMRWNYQSPEPSLWLASGTTFWMYEPEAKQAFKQDLKASQLPAAVAFLMGKGKLTDEFEVSLAKELPYGSPEDYRLSLKPKKAQSTYRSIYFVVDPKTYLVKQSVLVNAQGDVNSISFTDVVLNSKLGEELFRWTPPPGTRVVDGAALGQTQATAAKGEAGKPGAVAPPPPAKPVAEPVKKTAGGAGAAVKAAAKPAGKQPGADAGK
jgi:outer membrane lipoprotein carrier protein